MMPTVNFALKAESGTVWLSATRESSAAFRLTMSQANKLTSTEVLGTKSFSGADNNDTSPYSSC